MTKYILAISIIFINLATVHTQIDSTLLRSLPADTVKGQLNMDAVYNRPSFSLGKFATTVGGYAEINWQHLATDGVSEGHQFQMRRMTLFLSSSISKNIKFLSEIEFEEGGKEIAIEFAAIDVSIHPLLNLRGGVIINPIGAFNQNHDGPKWAFTDRPISATQMLPAAWSNAGFGLFGKTYKNDWMLGYECYLSGGFDDSIIDNVANKTFLPASKANGHRFEASASGTPLTTAKISLKHNKIAEIGLSYMGGIYNTFEKDGILLDDKRRVNVWAIDMNTTLPFFNTFITGEWAWVRVDVPATYTQQYGQKQQGGFVDIVQPILKRKVLAWENAVLNLACRFEYVDWNVGLFDETGTNIGDELWSIMPALSFRPSPPTVFRLNYRFQKQRDILNNDPAITGGFSFGLSTYF